jgi:tubulin--tyrosine ligase
MAHALVAWPSAPLTERLVRRSLATLNPPLAVSSCAPATYDKLIQWSTYDALDHEATHAHADTVLASSFVIRKALIRKHFLARCVYTYLVKHPVSALRAGVPLTWDVELAFADELDEKWADELWELGAALDGGDARWWILKPGMADRGMGIRLFDSKEALAAIFQEFEDDDDDDAEENEEDAGPSRGDTAVVTSQLRHFVIQVGVLWFKWKGRLIVPQEYMPNPLLLDPREVPLDSTAVPPVPDALRGHKVSPPPV